jgi:hypothetical protein
VLRGAVPGASAAELEAALEAAALDLGEPGPDNLSGAGYLDAADAFLRLSEAVPAPGDLQFGAADLLYLSLARDGTLVGLGPQGTDLAYADEDILAWDGARYRLVFDGSAAGLPAGADIVAFHLEPARHRILMAFRARLRLPGLGIVTGADIVAFDQDSGAFSLIFDGSDVGLGEDPGESLDALAVLPDGRLLVSTRGDPTVPGLRGAADEDLLAFTPTRLGADTRGTWSLYFDGSDVGLTAGDAEDLDAAAVAGDGSIFLSTRGRFAVAGVSGQDEDIFVCTPTALGPTTACRFAPFFDGTAQGLRGADLDAIDLPAQAQGGTPAPPPHCAEHPAGGLSPHRPHAGHGFHPHR